MRFIELLVKAVSESEGRSGFGDDDEVVQKAWRETEEDEGEGNKIVCVGSHCGDSGKFCRSLPAIDLRALLEEVKSLPERAGCMSLDQSFRSFLIVKN